MGNESGRPVSPEELKNRETRDLDQDLKRKLEQGQTYNLKVLLKGDRHTGKSCLFNILQGKGFVDEYVATKEMHVAHINWEYRASYDVVKVEVWDVVDKAKIAGKTTKDGLKVSSSAVESAEPDAPSSDSNGGKQTTVRGAPSPPDATVDVYRGANAVIMLVDPTKKWTYEYAQREVPKVPVGVSILLLANFRDQGEKWQVSAGELKDFARRSGAEYAESALINSFGLRSVQLFLNLPFLKNKLGLIEEQLKRTQEEMSIAQQELQLVTAESNYAKFVKWLTERKAAVTSPGPVNASPSPAAAARTATPPVSSSVSRQSSGAAIPPSTATPPTRKPAAAAGSARPTPLASGSSSSLRSPPPAAQKSPPAAASPVAAAAPAPESGFLSRMFGFSSAPPPASTPSPKPKAPTEPASDPVADLQKVARAASKAKAPAASIDDFKPVSSNALDDFFNDDPPPKTTKPAQRQQIIATAHEEDDDNDLVTRDETPAVAAAPAVPVPPVVKPAPVVKNLTPKPVAQPSPVVPQPAVTPTPPRPAPVAPLATAVGTTVAPPPTTQKSPPPAAAPLSPVASGPSPPPAVPMASKTTITPPPVKATPAPSIFEETPPGLSSGGDLDDFLNDDTPPPVPVAAKPSPSVSQDDTDDTFSSFGTKPFVPPVRAAPPVAAKAEPALSQAALAALAAAQAAALAEASQFEPLPESGPVTPASVMAGDAPTVKKKKPKAPGEKKKGDKVKSGTKKKAAKQGGMEPLP